MAGSAPGATLVAMQISAHLVAAVALLATLLVIVFAESSLRRRIRHFRSFQLFVITSGFLLIPANVVASGATTATTFHRAVLVASAATVIAQLVVGAVATIGPKPVARPRRVLAIGAHPDDLELACGGTLARLADAGHEIHALVMSDGSVGGNAATRPDEAYRGAAFMGLAECTVVGLPDTRLSSHEQEMVEAIEAKLRSLSPDLVLTHSRNDQHQDHAAVHWATMRAGRKHPAILCFESPSVTKDFSPQVFVDIDDYLDVKASAVAIHHDQSDKPYMGRDTLHAMATFRGSQSKLGVAEGFEAVRVPGFGGVL